MQKINKKTIAAIFAIFLAFLMASSIAFIPNANAHTPPYQIPTYAYISAEPTPIGVGQTLTIYMWLNMIYGVGYDSGAASAVSYSALYNSYRWQNYNLTVIDPSGKVSTTIFPTVTDPTANQFTTYTPAAVGTYTFIFTFPGQVYGANGDGKPGSVVAGDYYEPSQVSTTVTVQQNPIPAAIGSSPLPTSYWTRPIYGENTAWYTISSNWLGTGAPVSPVTGSGDLTAFSTGSGGWGSDVERYPGDAVGPLTGHVMWTKPIQEGGVVGGNLFQTGQGAGYFEGSAYCQRITNPIICNGILYYNPPVSFTGSTSGPCTAVDLATGKTLWTSTQIGTLSFAYIYNVWQTDQHGVYPAILFTSNFAKAYDAYTGLPLFSVSGAPSGYEALGLMGEHLRYIFTNVGNSSAPNFYLGEWNSSRLWDNTFDPWTGAIDSTPTLYNMSTATGAAITTAQAQYVTGGPQRTVSVPAGYDLNEPAGITNGLDNYPTNNYTVYGNVVNPSSPLYMYDWNVTVSGIDDQGTTPTIEAAIPGKIMLLERGTFPASPGAFTTPSWAPYTYYGISLAPGSIGKLLWTQVEQAPPGNVTVFYAGVDPTTNVFLEAHQETLSYVGYDLNTGKQLWTSPTPSLTSWDYYGQPAPSQIYAQEADGHFFYSGFGGVLFCYSDTTGKLEWTFGNGPFGSDNSTKAGLNVFYGDYPTFINAVGGGVVYLVSTEHTITDPIYKGALAHAINETTGQQIWTLSDYTGEFTTISYAMADGFSVFPNGYDNQLYCVGRGPSVTTVTAPNAGLSFGQAAVISGTVMDVSAGTQQTQQAADFARGVPVSSDASMQTWMGYVYQQQPMPTNFTGVPVTISVLDSNGNYRTIGTTTTDTSGSYSLTWTPDISGNYTVYANFAGTNGYWPSSAETHFYTGNPSPTIAPTATPVAGLASNNTLMYGLVSIIIVIVIIGAVLAILVTRKRP
ncbi:MAG: PQQ-binding-like beta-propeller repeat protein [Candidatus Bathyarchaeia archaeon]